MAQLGDLPSELLIHIASQVHPSSLLSFACLCRRFHLLSIEFLNEHKKNQRKYYEINDRYSLNIPWILKDILLDPRLAWYIRRLVFYSQRVSWSDYYFYDGPNPPAHRPSDEILEAEGQLQPYILSEDDIQLFIRAIHSNPHEGQKNETSLGCPSPNGSVISWADQIVNGFDGPLKLLLVSLLPNLQTLVVAAPIVGIRDFVHYFSETLRTIALSPEKMRPHYLGSLAKVHLNPCREGWERPERVIFTFKDLAPFFTLPALDTLRIGIGGIRNVGGMLYVEGEDEPAYEWEFEPRSSAVKHLDLGRMAVREKDVVNLLGATNSLKSFESKFYRYEGGYKIQEALVQNAGETLEFIHQTWSQRDPPLYTLRDYKKLTTISLTLNDMSFTPVKLIPQPAEEPNRQHLPSRLREIYRALPVSLEVLVLADPSSYHLWRRYFGPVEIDALQYGLCLLISKKQSMYTKLRSICVRKLFRNSKRENLSLERSKWKRVRETCEAASITFSESDTKPCSICVPSLPVIGSGLDSDWRPNACHPGLATVESIYYWG